MADDNKGIISNINSSISVGKDIIALVRDMTIIVVTLLLLLWPNKINDILVAAGFEEGSLAGFKWKAGLADYDAALKESQANNDMLKNQLDSVSVLLAEAQKNVTNPQLKNKIKEQTVKKERLNEMFLNSKLVVDRTIKANASLVKKAQISVNADNSWGIVYGADATLKEAQYEVGTIAKKYKIPNASIYFKQGLYRSVSVVSDRDEAEEVLANARKRRKDAYIVPLSVWCKESEEKEGFIECKGK